MIDPDMVAEESYMDLCDTLYHSMKKFYQDPENKKSCEKWMEERRKKEDVRQP